MQKAIEVRLGIQVVERQREVSIEIIVFAIVNKRKREKNIHTYIKT